MSAERLDRLQIHELPAYYGHVLDDRGWDRLDELFTREAALDYTRTEPIPPHRRTLVRPFPPTTRREP